MSFSPLHIAYWDGQFGASVILQPLFKVKPNGCGSIQANREWLNRLVNNYAQLFGDSKLQEILQEKYPDEDGEDGELLKHHLAQCHTTAVQVVEVLLEKAGGAALKVWGQQFFEEYATHQELNVGNH